MTTTSERRARGLRIAARVALYGGALVVAYVVVAHPRLVLRLFEGRGTYSVESIVARHEERVAAAFRPALQRAGQDWPPHHVELVAFKHEKLVELWAGKGTGELVRVAVYPILAASGRIGPKYEEGDAQVPEGVYGVPVLNPNSRYHLSMLVDYPNADDVARARVPRDQMGGEIYVHGRNVSVGCIALGDPAIEEVFTTFAQVDAEERRVVIAPYDFRRGNASAPALPDVPGLYEKLRAAVAAFPVDGVQAAR